MSFATADERYFIQLVNNTRARMGLALLEMAKPLNSSAEVSGDKARQTD